jgi:hypothetical protein
MLSALISSALKVSPSQMLREMRPEMVEPKIPDGISQSSPLAANHAQPAISDKTTKGKGRPAKRHHCLSYAAILAESRLYPSNHPQIQSIRVHVWQ